MIARWLSLFLALAAILWSHSAAALFRYPSTCGGGCARVSAYRDARGPLGGSGGGIGDWACGSNTYDGHRGTDFAMGRGNTIVAGASGVVTNARDGVFDGCTTGTCSPGEGNFVEIRDSSGRRARYLHMRTGSVAVSIGATVACGQKLGEVASSGASTGNHLHFDVRPDGASVASCFDPFQGPCGSGSSSWTSQGGYNGLPGTECSGVDEDGDGSPRGIDCDDKNPLRTPGRPEVCDNIDNDCDGVVDDLVRGCGTDVGECVPGAQRCTGGTWGACEGGVQPVPEFCDEKDNDCDGASDEEQVCEHEEVAIGAPIYSDGANSDLNGDGRADACALTGSGFQCMLASGTGFDRLIAGPELALDGLLPRQIVPSLRMGDIDGDGRADVCTRVGSEIVCFRSTGDGFGERLLLAPMGTLAPGAYGPLVLLGDVDGDRAEDVCVRDVDGLRCYVAIGRGGSRVLTLPALSDAAGFANVVHYGTLRLGDVDGDGRADVCARGSEGVVCFLADGNGFGRRVIGPAWSDASGWDALRYWSTIRLRDIDGDGRADLCGRGPEGFRCHLSEEGGFSGPRTGPLLADADGFDDRALYSTLRLGDIDGDGRGDLCARERSGVHCWLWSGSGFGRELIGPALSDDAGWSTTAAYRSLRLGDIDGDGHDDLCARNGEGLRCYTSAGGRPLGRMWLAPAWNDAGLTDPWHRMSIRLGGGAPHAKMTAEEEDRGCGCGVVGAPGRPLAALAMLSLLLLARTRSRR